MTSSKNGHRVALIGAGKMGGAMLSGWLAKGYPGENFHIVDPFLSDEMMALRDRYGFTISEDCPDAFVPDVVIVAVKPQMMTDVLPKLSGFADHRPVFVSVAAGTSIATFTEFFGADAAIVRAMPNTPAQVGRGVTIGYPNEHVSEEQKLAVADLLAVTGMFDWVGEEALIDAVTAVSGSGPAYVFHMVEALGAAARETGLAPDLADKLARQTIVGAGELLHQSDLPASTLRENVTSPGGTTAAALAVLMEEAALTDLMTDAVKAAKDRAEELGRS